jgi:hypothetical protein
MSSKNVPSQGRILIASAILVAVFVSVYLGTRNSAVRSDNAKAMDRAERVAQKLIAQKFFRQEDVPASPDKSRGLASAVMRPVSARKLEGELARDPWGYPFHYKVITVGDQPKLIFWSAGEGQKFNRSDDELNAWAKTANNTEKNVRDLYLVMPIDKSIIQ